MEGVLSVEAGDVMKASELGEMALRLRHGGFGIGGEAYVVEVKEMGVPLAGQHGGPTASVV